MSLNFEVNGKAVSAHAEPDTPLARSRWLDAIA